MVFPKSYSARTQTRQPTFLKKVMSFSEYIEKNFHLSCFESSLMQNRKKKFPKKKIVGTSSHTHSCVILLPPESKIYTCPEIDFIEKIPLENQFSKKIYSIFHQVLHFRSEFFYFFLNFLGTIIFIFFSIFFTFFT